MASIINWKILSNDRDTDANHRSNAALLLANIIPIAMVLYLAQVTYYLFFHPLHSVPGPFLARFSKAWRNIRYFRGTWLDDVLALHSKYGPIARIAPNEISFVDEFALKQLFGPGKPSQKTSWYNTWTAPGMGVSFFATTDAKLHKHLRSRVAAIYSMSSMLSFEPLIQQVLDANWKKLRELAQTGDPIDISLPVTYFTFDAVSQLCFGGMLGFIEKQRDISGLIKSIHNGFYLMSNMGDMPGQMWGFNNPVSQYTIKRFGGDELNSMNFFVSWLDARVSERMKNGLEEGRYVDMLQRFIEAKDPEGRPIQKEDVIMEASQVLGAGADTTTGSILAILGQVLMDSTVYKKLQAEIDKAYTELRIPEGQEIEFKAAEKLQYLSLVIKESMRLFPSIPYQLPREIPKEGLTINGYQLPKGVKASISPAVLNRSTELFGDDAAKFRPERWLPHDDSDEEAKRLRVMEGNLTTFGMGSRNCVGRNLALVETYKFIAQFIRHFDAEVVNKEKPWIVKTQWFALQYEFWIKLTARSHRM